MIHQLLCLRDVHPSLRILCHFTYSATQPVYECSYSFIFILVRVCVCVLNAKVWAKFDFLFWGKSPTKPLFTLHLADMESHLQEDFQSDIDATLQGLFKRWAGLHGFSDLYLEHGCGIPMEHSAAPPGKYKNQLLDRLESHIPNYSKR